MVNNPAKLDFMFIRNFMFISFFVNCDRLVFRSEGNPNTNKLMQKASSHGNRLLSFKVRDTTGGFVPEVKQRLKAEGERGKH
jgi:hypothetical protein